MRRGSIPNRSCRSFPTYAKRCVSGWAAATPGSERSEGSKLLGAAASPGYDDKGADMTGDVVQAGKNLIHKVEVDLA